MLQKCDDFLKIKTIEDLCDILNISKGKLYFILFVKENNYKSFKIPKKSGGFRIINSPTKDLKKIQKRLSSLLYECYDFLDVQHGFIKNKSCVTNASNHINKRYVLNLDLENFFDTIHFGRVRGLFMNKPFCFNNQVATFISKLVCHNKKLPQGSPTSPVISNIICYKMDKELEYLAHKNRCTYSRYADDITFSTNSDKFPTKIAYIQNGEIVLSNKLINIINGGYETGFRINQSKTRLSKKMMRQEVTGIIVNERINLNKKYIKNLRAMLHSIKKIGFLETYRKNYNDNKLIDEKVARYKMFNLLQGKLNYLKMVRGYNDKIFLKYAKEFNEIFKIELFDVDTIIDLEKYASDRCLVLQSEDEDSQGTAFFIQNKVLYTSTHILINKTTFKDFVHDKNNNKYLRQFPITPFEEILPFFYLKNDCCKIFFNYKIEKTNYESDILFLNEKGIKSKFFNIAKEEVKIGDKVYLIGYSGFVDFNRTSITIIETKIISIATFLDRKFFVTKDSPIHGMSGGPVINKKREVVGIVYAGADLDNDYKSDKVGFISII